MTEFPRIGLFLVGGWGVHAKYMYQTIKIKVVLQRLGMLQEFLKVLFPHIYL